MEPDDAQMHAEANEADTSSCIEHLSFNDRTDIRTTFSLEPEPVPDPQVVQGSGLSCADVLDLRVGSWDPSTIDDSPNHLGGKLRREELLRVCDEWNQGFVDCLSASPTEDCLQHLDADERQQVAAAIASADERLATLHMAMTKPATITCTKLAAVHYPEATWKKLRPKETAAQRKKALAVARLTMSDECTAKTWPAEVRACLAVDSRDTCFELGELDPDVWRIAIDLDAPPLTGIVECDAYVKEAWALGTCEALPLEARNGIKRGIIAASEAWTSLPGDAKDAARSACEGAAEAVRQAATSAGC